MGRVAVTDDRERVREGLEAERQRLLDALYRERFGPDARAPRVSPYADPSGDPYTGSTGGGEAGPRTPRPRRAN